MRADYEKIIQAINFFARKRHDKKISKLYFLKLIFLADRYHLRMYGRMITNDNYVAMDYGPVASSTKSTFEFLNIPEPMQQYASLYLKPVDDRWIRSLKEEDKDVFSKTDIEALQAAWETFQKTKGRYNNLIDLTHKFPEWKKHETILKQLNATPMDIFDFFEDAPNDVEYCPANSERVAQNKKHFSEIAYLM